VVTQYFMEKKFKTCPVSPEILIEDNIAPYASEPWGSAQNLLFLREGPCSEGASWVVYGSGVPPYMYDFLNLYGIFDSRFCASFS
jgi:hypothetical protein